MRLKEVKVLKSFVSSADSAHKPKRKQKQRSGHKKCMKESFLTRVSKLYCWNHSQSKQ